MTPLYIFFSDNECSFIMAAEAEEPAVCPGVWQDRGSGQQQARGRGKGGKGSTRLSCQAQRLPPRTKGNGKKERKKSDLIVLCCVCGYCIYYCFIFILLFIYLFIYVCVVVVLFLFIYLLIDLFVWWSFNSSLIFLFSIYRSIF